MNIQVECRDCGNIVVTNVISYGDGYIGVCPDCKRIAYSSLKKPIDPNEVVKLAGLTH